MGSIATKTKVLVLSDTHGIRPRQLPSQEVDVAIHCGDITQHSKLEEFVDMIDMMKQIKAPLKIMIAGNHDFSLDPPVFDKKIREACRIAGEDLDTQLVIKEYGNSGDSHKLLQHAKEHDIHFLSEGSYSFVLANGAHLKIYASPYTPNPTHEQDLWGFQYSSQREFPIPAGTDIVISHGPPRGLLDMSTDKQRLGCQSLFAAVARAQPKVHCFGHVHNGWGAKFVAWRTNISQEPSHFTDIDNGNSRVITTLAKLGTTHGDIPSLFESSHCSDDELSLGEGKTLFVNAALRGMDGTLSQPMWLLNIDLDRAGA